MFSATFNAEEYQQNITSSLDEVETQSSTLIKEAQMSSNYEMSRTMRMILYRKLLVTKEFPSPFPFPFHNIMLILVRDIAVATRFRKDTPCTAAVKS